MRPIKLKKRGICPLLSTKIFTSVSSVHTGGKNQCPAINKKKIITHTQLYKARKHDLHSVGKALDRTRLRDGPYFRIIKDFKITLTF